MRPRRLKRLHGAFPEVPLRFLGEAPELPFDQQLDRVADAKQHGLRLTVPRDDRPLPLGNSLDDT